MRFRRALLPLIRLCQCSGMCPISARGVSRNATLETNKSRFAALTAAIFVVQSLFCACSLVHSHIYIDWEKSTIMSYVSLLVSLTIRFHVGTILIESYVNRSIIWRLLEKYDEIETIFVDKLRLEINSENLRGRCCHYIIVWAIKVGSFTTMVFLSGIVLFRWQNIYVLAVTFPSFYTSTLFHTQLLVYLEIVKYNIETISKCLAKLKPPPRIDWLRLHQRPVLPIDSSEIRRQLIDLRVCYCKTWEASALINRNVRWSLLLGINNDFVLFVSNLYGILYHLIYFTYWDQVVVYIMFAAINISHFVHISMLCDQIMEQVRSNIYKKTNGLQ